MPTLPGAEWIPAPSGGGGFAYDAPNKLMLHTTEGPTIEAAVSAYRSHGAWPHCTVDPLTRRIVEHIPYNRSASALYNGPQPMEPNRANVVLQVEIVGRAANTHTYSDDWYRWLATKVVRPLCDLADVPARCTRFYGAMHGTIAVQGWPGRFQDDRFNGYAGILGHQNVGDGNDHWDPGALDQDRLLMFAFGYGEIYDPITRQTRQLDGTLVPAVEEDELTPEQSEAFKIITGVLTPTYPLYGRPVSLADIIDLDIKNFAAMQQALGQMVATLQSIDAKLTHPSGGVDIDALADRVVAVLGDKLNR